MEKRLVAALALSLTIGGIMPATSAPVLHKITTVNGLKVDQYTWRDSKNRMRTVSLKREGEGNPGHGGYAVQMTYQEIIGGVLKTVVANAAAGNDGGFGYFVSHERYRDFTDGVNDTIAHHVFATDDSPLGRNFPVVGKSVVLGANAAAHRFTLRYPRYGTVDPIAKRPNGNDARLTPIGRSKLKLYQLPVFVTWIFQSGFDYPRIQTNVSFRNVPGPDFVNFDLRGPYGVMVFDNNRNKVISQVMWGDRFHFRTVGGAVTRNSAWKWNQPNRGARYSALTAGGFEMGLLEPVTFAKSKIPDGYSDARGKTSDTYNGGQGCRPNQNQLVPCDWEWPYQSLQYSLPYNNPDATTNFKKMAWGSAPFWGTGPSLRQVYDSSETFKNFVGYPAGGEIVYDICVVLGKTVPGGLTRSAAAGPDYNCAKAALP